MDQDETWHEVCVGPGLIVWGPSSPPQKKETQESPVFGPCLLWPNGWVDQDANGTEVGLGPGDIVLMEIQHPLERGTAPPLFSPCLLWPNVWMDGHTYDDTWYGGRPRPRPHCVRWRPSFPPNGAQQSPPLFGPCLLWPNGRPSQLLLSTCSTSG